MTEKEAIYYELLVVRCRLGRREALQELVQTWEKRLFYYIRRLVDYEQEAWQILQETWVKVLRGVKGLREPRKLPAWLYGIARNTAISHLRTKYRREAVLEQATSPGNIESSADNLAFEDAEQVHHGLGRLSLHHREVLTLFFLQDLPIEEIAGVLAIPLGTVKSRLNYAKQALRAVLEKEAANNE